MLGAWLDPARAGALGNTGDAAEAALPCALLGLVLAAGIGPGREEHVAWRIVGGVTAAAFATWCITTPSITGALAFALTAVVAAALLSNSGTTESPRRTGIRRPRMILAGAGGLVLTVLFASQAQSFIGLSNGVERQVAAADEEAPEIATDPGDTDPVDTDPGDLGGFGVRKQVWASTLELVRDHPWTGVGPGQFARAFPPYRAAAEIEISSLGRSEVFGSETEVEHPHNDWLVAFAELGLLGGGAWCAFLLTALIAAWRALRGADPTRFALGAASVGLLVDSLAHAPLTDNPAASGFACAAFGALLARSNDGSPTSPIALRVVPVAALALLVFAVPDARALVQHGWRLADLARVEERWEDAPAEARAKRSLVTVAKALEQRPDSTLANTLRARFSERSGAAPEDALEAWSAVLAQRPHRFEALMQVGTLHAREGDTREARAFYDHARELDPLHPGLLQNRVRLELLDGRIEQGRDILTLLSEHAPPEHEWFERFGAELLLRGLDREALVVFQRIGEMRTEDGTSLWQRSKELRDQERGTLADGYEAQAHRAWAREHVEAGRYHDAVRSYRQCLRLTSVFDARGALRVRMELAAAAMLDGDEDEARERLADERPSAADWAALPSWAGERLLATGWFDA
jgi:O-antigen ligase/tetratricopeptide (TPR) repeat protein